jgi:hypothetical protein
MARAQLDGDAVKAAQQMHDALERTRLNGWNEGSVRKAVALELRRELDEQNIKLSAWGKYLGDTTLAAAILDRLAANSIHIDIDGPSYRQHLARRRAKEQGLEPPADEAQA